MAINYDSTLWTWGGNFGFQRAYDTPRRLDSNKNWKEISTGNKFAVALRSDGTLWGWGDNSYGQLGDGTTTNRWTITKITSDSNWIKVTCGEHFTVALKSNGTIWAWGRNHYGQIGQGTNRTTQTTPIQIGTDSNFVDVSAGKYLTLLRKPDNSLWHVGACYNSANFSQLTQVGTTSDWSTMSGGSHENYAIKQNGTLWEFVSANGRPSGLSQIGSSSDWKIAGNSFTYSPEYHALFVKTNGTLWAMGDNRFGQLGTGDLVSTSLPFQVGTDANWREVIAGQHLSIALKDDNSFWAWGRNNHAQFGNGQNKNSLLPINSSIDWKMISMSTDVLSGHGLGLKADGTIWSWGQNNDGQLGIGTTYTHQAIPVQVGTDTNWKMVTNAFGISLGIKNDGTLWNWGRNIGLGFSFPLKVSIPMQIGTDTNWLSVSAGGTGFAIGLKKNGTLWAFGDNGYGQLGNGSTTDTRDPIQIGVDSNWAFVSAGNRFSTALKKDSSLWTWGDDSYGQLGRSGSGNVPAQVTTNKWLTIACGGNHTLAIRKDSSLWACGLNSSGQLGDNSSTNRSSLVRVGSDYDWWKIQGGGSHSLAIKKDSSLWVWGLNSSGQIGDSSTYIAYPTANYIPTNISVGTKWKEVSGGRCSSLALREDGVLFSMGSCYVVDWQSNFPVLGYVYSSPVLINGCSIPCLSTYSQLNDTICQGNSYLFGSNNLTASGTYKDTILNAAGCDSIATLTLLVNSNSLSIDVVTACDSYTWINGMSYTSSNNTAKDTLVNSLGCDSIITLNLIIKQSSSFIDVVTACGSFTWIDGKTYTSSNFTAKDTLINNEGCDSIVTLNLTLGQKSFNTDIISACDSLTWINGITYFSSNNLAKDTLVNSMGCDSVVTLNLTLGQKSSGVDVVTACNSHTWINGTTYISNNNSAKDTLVNSSGCDSIVTLNLTIKQSSSFIDVISACDSYTWINGATFTSNNNTAKDTLVNSYGCDSIVTLNLTIKQSSSSVDMINSCGSYTWINGTTYTTSNSTAKDTLVNSMGCDSIITLNLTLGQSSSFTDVVNACNSYIWIDGRTYVTNNSTAKDTLVNQLGCDSIITLNLTITNIDNSVSVSGITHSSNESGARYQWLDCNNSFAILPREVLQTYIPRFNGSYAVQITKNGCVDTSGCQLVNSVGVEENGLANEVKLYPNPTTGEFQLTFSQPQSVVVTIMDVQGKVMETRIVSGVTIEGFSLNSAAPGIYFVRIQGNKESTILKVIKE